MQLRERPQRLRRGGALPGALTPARGQAQREL
jgi:hypothetical protein